MIAAADGLDDAAQQTALQISASRRDTSDVIQGDLAVRLDIERVQRRRGQLPIARRPRPPAP